MKITIRNRQKHPRINPLAAETLVRFFLDHTARRGLPPREWGEIALTFLGHKEMREANMSCFGNPGTTDVISATYTPLPGEPALTSADLVVNAELAGTEGERRPHTRNGQDWGVPCELALYMAHGCNHLLGGEDTEPKERRGMRRRELGWIRHARQRGLLDGLVMESPMGTPRRSGAAAPRTAGISGKDG